MSSAQKLRNIKYFNKDILKTMITNVKLLYQKNEMIEFMRTYYPDIILRNAGYNITEQQSEEIMQFLYIIVKITLKEFFASD